jgi:hypothetical protein
MASAGLLDLIGEKNKIQEETDFNETIEKMNKSTSHQEKLDLLDEFFSKYPYLSKYPLNPHNIGLTTIWRADHRR